MKSKIAKTCIICQDKFYPDRRVERRRKVCDNLQSKLENKRQSQQRWVKANPDYFKGRYPQLREKIIKNKLKQKKSDPGHSQSFEREPINILKKGIVSYGIQDDLTSNKNKILNRLNSIQVDITSIISNIFKELNDVTQLVYKSI